MTIILLKTRKLQEKCPWDECISCWDFCFWRVENKSSKGISEKLEPLLIVFKGTLASWSLGSWILLIKKLFSLD